MRKGGVAALSFLYGGPAIYPEPAILNHSTTYSTLLDLLLQFSRQFM
jgi:hypothetical protein